MTIRKAVRKGHRQHIGWHALFSVALLSSAIVGCKSQQTQSQPPAMPSMPSSSSQSQSQSQSNSSSSSSSQSSSQSQTASSSGGQPRSSSSSQPSTSMPSAKRESQRSSDTASAEGQSSRERSAGNSMPDSDSRSRSSSTPVYSDSEQSQQSQNTPSDPSSGDEGTPPDEIDFSEEEQTASSSSSSSSNSASSSSSSSASSNSNSANAGQPGNSADRAGSAPNEAPNSAAEQVAELEGRFESTMVSYDGMILRERDYVRNRPGSASTEGEEEAMDEAPSGESLEDLIESAEAEIPAPPGSGTPTGGGPQQNNSSGQVTGPGLPTKGRQGDYNHSGTQAVVPADIPNGTDDDVVARQIREAATRETDPELREKLWEEYRKYKKATK
ncbi:hypothetical protein [Microbulbifer sp. GL-2]|uniref:hypothetical protein n=1 Tax=Microbulbifer sp. GL-2 TaxID=2591606 RepID=UPI00117F2591|nr:hypothetical protein [Microbulbifer sp. GL-2]